MHLCPSTEPGAPAPDTDPVATAIARFQAGIDRDEQFRTIYEAHSAPLHRFFARKRLSPEICQDLVQRTFLGVYRGLDGWQPDARFETWLYRIATTTFLKWLRRRTAAKRSGVELSVDAATMDPDGNVAGLQLAVDGTQLASLLAVERARTLRSAVAKLPDQMRRCLTLRLDHDLPCREIARNLQVSPGTVKAHLYQARGRLRTALAA